MTLLLLDINIVNLIKSFLMTKALCSLENVQEVSRILGRSGSVVRNTELSDSSELSTEEANECTQLL